MTTTTPPEGPIAVHDALGTGLTLAFRGGHYRPADGLRTLRLDLLDADDDSLTAGEGIDLTLADARRLGEALIGLADITELLPAPDSRPTGEDMARCVRCARTAPDQESDEFLGWEAAPGTEGEAVVCPDCLTPAEEQHLSDDLP